MIDPDKLNPKHAARRYTVGCTEYGICGVFESLSTVRYIYTSKGSSFLLHVDRDDVGGAFCARLESKHRIAQGDVGQLSMKAYGSVAEDAVGNMRRNLLARASLYRELAEDGQ